MLPRWKQLKENARLRKNLETRAAVLKAIRGFFDARGYLEAETPILVAKPGMEPHLEPFEAELRDPRGRAYRGFLVTSPEYALKKLLAAGFPKVYQLGKCFRNGEEFGGRHNPEFTMLEWYRAGTDYRGIMDETEALVRDVARRAAGPDAPLASGVPWERLTVREAMRRHAGVDLDAALEDVSLLTGKAAALGHALPTDAPWDDAFFSVFLNAVEPQLGKDRPVFLHDYPASMAALSKVSQVDARYAERFELYVDGLEMANAYTELTDPAEQRRRLEEERALRRRLGRSDYGLDEELLSALGDMPEAGGISIGVDRLVMVLTGEKDIRDVLAFPADALFE